MEQRLAKLDLHWTVVRMPWLSDHPELGLRSAIGSPLHPGAKLGRKDHAAYLISIINDRGTLSHLDQGCIVKTIP
jgi:hypothetical protein